MKPTTKFLLAFGLLAAVTSWLLAGSQPSQNLLVTFCDVGQGDAVLISYQNQQMLIDGGPGKAVLDCLNHYLPLGDKIIELVVITHPDRDHLGGIVEVLDHYRVNQLATIPVGKDTQVYGRLIDRITTLQQSNQLTAKNIFSGDKLEFGPVTTTVIWPERKWLAQRTPGVDVSSPSLRGGLEPPVLIGPDNKTVLGATTTHTDINDFSIVLHLQFGDFDLLLNGDAEAEVQDEQLDTGLLPTNVEVMNEPHHGSRNGLLPEWLETVSPDLTVISVGAANTYGHPAPEILSKLQSANSRVLRTDQSGDITIETDGKNWWVTE